MVMKETQSAGFKLLEHLLVLGMSIMGLMVLFNVILRYAFNSGLVISEEVSRFIFVWLTFLGSIVALKDGIHLGVDTLVRRLPGPIQKICYWISHLLMLWCCWLLWKGSWIQTKLNWDNLAPISEIPVAMMYGSGLVAAVFMALILLHNLWRSATGELLQDLQTTGKEEPHLLPLKESAK